MSFWKTDKHDEEPEKKPEAAPQAPVPQQPMQGQQPDAALPPIPFGSQPQGQTPLPSAMPPQTPPAMPPLPGTGLTPHAITALGQGAQILPPTGYTPGMTMHMPPLPMQPQAPQSATKLNVQPPAAPPSVSGRAMPMQPAPNPASVSKLNLPPQSSPAMPPLPGQPPQSSPKLAPALSQQQQPQQFAVVDQQLEQRFSQLLKTSGRTPAIELAVQISDLILTQAVLQRASDIHFEFHGSSLKVRFRIDGILQDALLVPRNQNIPITQRLRVLAGFDPEPPANFRAEEGRFQKVLGGKTVQVRVSSFPTINGEKLVLRVLDRTQMGLSLDQLGLETKTLDTIKKVIQNPYGIFFVTGATGSGKTTTLYAILKTITTPVRNTVTLEDPVEYRMEGMNQAQINQKNGFTWNEGLRTVLRQDPDIVMVGEVRDHENAEISMRAALTGHLILTTIHTISAPSVVERLYEMGIPPFLIASSTLGSMAQRLVRRVCPQCATPAAPPEPAAIDEMLRMLAPEEGDVIKEIISRPGAQFKNAVGCPACRGTGYLGRTGIFEIMLMNEELRKQVLSHATTDQLKRTAIQSGMKTLLMDGIEKSWAGITTLPEVLRVTATMV
ncbi:MAG: Flp pilus assembly complex ATPase component TadA [Elusimicrobia bacterium]|nr:Flp pilus assembly complex ATPase component TadA [Elusimicrobiota bacterium]